MAAVDPDLAAMRDWLASQAAAGGGWLAEPPGSVGEASGDELSEAAVTALLRRRADRDGALRCFIGAGAYAHHVPAAAWEQALREEFVTSAAQHAGACQGSLQVIYELQSLLAAMTGMAAATVVLPHGVWALAEALRLMEGLATGPGATVLLPRSVHPGCRRALAAWLGGGSVALREVGFSLEEGRLSLDLLEEAVRGGRCAALVIAQPNFFGVLEEVDELTDWAHGHGVRVVALVNPISLALLKPPVAWGLGGADAVVGELQSLGLPLAWGGAGSGFLAVPRQHVRHLPGWLSMREGDADGAEPFVPVAFSPNECRGEEALGVAGGLWPPATTVAVAASMWLRGAPGLQGLARKAHQNTRRLVDRLTDHVGIDRRFSGAFFCEAVLDVKDLEVDELLRTLAAHNVLGGYPLGGEYPELENTLLVGATEVHTDDDFKAYEDRLRRAISLRTQPACPVRPRI